ncbi:MAG: thiol peroxidase [Planctomycetota bacterium]
MTIRSAIMALVLITPLAFTCCKATPEIYSPRTPAQTLDAMPERPGLVALRGNPVTLLGEGVEVGQAAPEFVVVGQDMQEQSLSDYRGKTVIFSVVPSLDTGVCATQTTRFNQEAAALGEDVVVLTVSMDLPMAQKRFCTAEGIDRLVTLSDYRYWSVGTGWGLRIKENGLLARSIHVVDPSGTLVYQQIVPELTTEPDYAAALAAAKQAAG